MPPRAHRVLIPLAAFLAILPILIYGPSCGHDFDFHLLSWLEASTQFAHFGFPHWAYTPAWNAGEPRFIFYPPISWTLGGLLGLVLPWQFVPAAFTWIALTLSGVTAHRLARRILGPAANPTPALFAATLYLANPYMLFTAYERSAYAELLAAAFLPLLFQAALKPTSELGAPRLASETWDRTTSIAIPIALLWLTNAPAAVMACYALAVLTLVRLVLLPGTPRLQPWLLRPPGNRALAPGVCSPKLRLALTTTSGLLLGLTLAAVYILPAAYERKYVQVDLATITGMRPADHFLFHRMSATSGFTPADMAFHDAVVHTASLIALTLLAAITAAFVFLWANKKNVIPSEARSAQSKALFRTHKDAVILSEAIAPSAIAQSKDPDAAGPTTTARPFLPQTPLLALTLLIAFLLTPPSAFLWRILPQLHFLQFPWRLCALLAVILCIAVAQALSLKLPSLKLENQSLSPQAVSLKLPSLKLENHSLPPQAVSSKLLSFKLKIQSLWLIAPLLFAAALIFPAWHYFHQPCDEEDNIAARVALFHSNLGTGPTDEYTPADADPDALHQGNPPYWLTPGLTPDSLNSAPPNSAQPGQAPTHLSLTLASPSYLILNRRAFPGERLVINGKQVALADARPDGLIDAALPAGTDTIDLKFTETPDRLAGLALSTTTAALTIFITWKRRTRPSPMHTS